MELISAFLQIFHAKYYKSERVEQIYRMKSRSCPALPCIMIILLLASLQWSCSESPSNRADKPKPGVLPDILFSHSSESVEVYDFIEVTINVGRPTAQNPFRDIFVTGNFEQANNHDKVAVEGFCDSTDGSIFRIRFMPTQLGDYIYTVTYWQDNLQKVHKGKFKAINGNRRGIVQVDPAHPWHFIWKGTGNTTFLTEQQLFC